MKSINKCLYLCVLGCVLFVAGCTDMDLEPQGGTFTENQKKELVKNDPAKLQADVNGLYSGLIKLFSISDQYGNLHFDFGYAGACMIYDATGMDVPSEYSGYNWFNKPMRFVDRTATSEYTYFLWTLYYNHMKTANDIISVVDETTDNPTLKAYLGQALASRAFDYLNLVQIYQFTYKGHEDAPAIPIVTDKTTTAEAGNNPRATVREVYELIMSDLNKSIALLEGYERGTRKESINQNVAYGLRARANLNMENWLAAAADAEKALAGYTPYSIAEVSKPTFNSITASSWIWGNAITENNAVVKSGIINFPSHMCSLTGNGYSPGYAGRYINRELWLTIPATDVRKGWWTDSKNNTPDLDYTWTKEYNGQKYGVVDWFGFQAPYLNVKFGPYQNIYDNPTNACDFPMMRAEEMFLIKAEGLAMGGGDGKSVLEGFIKTYRDPAYVCKANTPSAIQDEIWRQRRIELWGEGFSFFDLKRLKKELVRKGTNFPAQVAYNVAPESQIFLWLIPQDETSVNGGITVADNNPVATVPKP